MEGRAKKKGIEYYTQLQYSILLHQIDDEGKKYWIAEVPELPGCKSHGSTVEEAVESVGQAKKDWIEDSLVRGEEVPIPVERERYSGRMLVRMSRSLHRALSLTADSEKLSLNQLIVTILAKEVGRLNVLNRVEDKIERLLNKVNNVVDREAQVTFVRSIRGMAGGPEQGQYFLAGTGHTPEVPGASNLGVIASGGASTSPFEELWTVPYGQRIAGQGITYVAGDETEVEPRETVESKN